MSALDVFLVGLGGGLVGGFAINLAVLVTARRALRQLTSFKLPPLATKTTAKP